MDCIDLEAETITFPAPKGGEVKSFTIPMPDALQTTSEMMKADGRKVTLQMPFQPSRKWGHFKTLGLDHLCFHCLRVTKVTRLRREGVPREVAMRFLNHSSELIHLVYDRHRGRAYSDAKECWIRLSAPNNKIIPPDFAVKDREPRLLRKSNGQRVADAASLSEFPKAEGQALGAIAAVSLLDHFKE